jgi:choline dehydrogenase-like flavoprotein
VVLYGLEYLMFKSGPLTACVCEAGAFLRSSDEVASPDIQIHCLPAFVIDHGRQRVKGHGLTINTCNLRPRSIGEVTLRSADPMQNPLINPNFLADPYDWKISIEGFKFGRRLLQSRAFAPFIKREHMPGAQVQSEADIKAYIRQWSKTDYHPVGSCKMGHDDQAVVDTDLRVRGLEGLRVVDASIMPLDCRANTNLTTIMIGERMADRLRADLP